MAKWSSEYKTELHKLIIKIRGSLPKLVRMVIVALVTTDVHARDIIEELQVRNYCIAFVICLFNDGGM